MDSVIHIPGVIETKKKVGINSVNIVVSIKAVGISLNQNKELERLLVNTL
jgi:hypothetical protein